MLHTYTQYAFKCVSQPGNNNLSLPVMGTKCDICVHCVALYAYVLISRDRVNSQLFTCLLALRAKQMKQTNEAGRKVTKNARETSLVWCDYDIILIN